MANGSSQSTNTCPPHSPTRTTNNSILNPAGAFHEPNTSSIRFWAFSYSAGEPCGRSNQLIMYFIAILLIVLDLGTIAVWTGICPSSPAQTADERRHDGCNRTRAQNMLADLNFPLPQKPVNSIATGTADRGAGCVLCNVYYRLCRHEPQRVFGSNE